MYWDQCNSKYDKQSLWNIWYEWRKRRVCNGKSCTKFTNGNAEFGSTPSIKYYDSYSTHSESSTHGRGKLGDATKETLVEFGNRYNRYAAWYGGASDFLSTWPWMSRGASGPADKSKTFSFAYESGTANSNGSRSVVSAL